MTKYRIVELNNGQFVVQKLVGAFRGNELWNTFDTFKTEAKARQCKEQLEHKEQEETDRLAAEAHAKGIKRVVE